MKKILIFWIATVSVILIPEEQAAQPPQPSYTEQCEPAGRPLFFEEALELTLGGNPRMEAAGYEQAAATQERKAAFGLRLPKIGVSGTYAHMGKDVVIDLNDIRDGSKGIFDGLTGTLGAQGIVIPQELLQGGEMLYTSDWSNKILDRNFAFVSGNITLPVYAGGKINAANRAARIKEETSRAKGDQTRGSLISELVERYYGVILADNVVKIRQQVVDAVDHHLRDALALEDNGMISRSERLFVEVKRSEADSELIAARLLAETTRSALANTLNDNGNYIPTSDMFTLERLPVLGTFIKSGLENNPSLQQVGLTKDLAVEGMKAQRAEFMPQVALMGGANFYKYNMSNVLPKWVVGAGVSLTIFDGLNREHKYSAARYTVRQAEAMQTKVENDIAVYIEQLYNELRNYEERMPAIEKTIEFRREYLRVTNAGFREGVTSASNVIDAELDLASTLIEKMQTAYQYDVTLARLLEIAGASDDFTEYAHSEGSRQIVIN